MKPPDSEQRQVAVFVPSNDPTTPRIALTVVVGEEPAPPYVVTSPDLVQFGEVTVDDLPLAQRLRVITRETGYEPWIVGAVASTSELEVEEVEASERSAGEFITRERTYLVRLVAPGPPGASIAATIEFYLASEQDPVLSIPVRGRFPATSDQEEGDPVISSTTPGVPSPPG